jgi:hypothetical protein
MLKRDNHSNLMVVDLTDKVSVSTAVPRANHAALRSGFVGYPANPRWNVTKFCAWRTGRQWREALAQGKMIVRRTDSMLVPATDKGDSQEDELPSSTILFASSVLAGSILAVGQAA